MNEVLVRAALGDAGLAEKVRALSRDDLEQVAASAIALARHSSRGKSELGPYARKIVDHSLTTLLSTLTPLTEDGTDLVLNSL